MSTKSESSSTNGSHNRKGRADPDRPQKKRGRPFEKGRSGNPSGRPQGARNKATILAEELLDGQSEALVRKLLDLALSGDVPSLRLCIDRLVPPRRERPLVFSLPPLRTVDDALAAINAIATGASQGELSDSEANTLVSIVNSFCEARSAVEFGNRLSRLETMQRIIEDEQKAT